MIGYFKMSHFLIQDSKNEALNIICKGTYAGIRSNYKKFRDEKSKITDRQMVEMFVLKWCVQYAFVVY